MNQKKKSHAAVLKIFGGIGYFTVFLEWFWLAALYLPGFFDSELGKTIFPKSAPIEEPLPVTTTAVQEPSILLLVGTIALAVVVIVAVFYVVFAKYIPAATKAATKVAHVATERMVPVVAHKPVEKIPARKRKMLTERVLFWVKLLSALTPLLVVFATRSRQEEIESQVLLLGFAVLTALATVFFVLQTHFSRRWKLTDSL